MFRLSSNVKIGSYAFRGGFNDLNIKRSVLQVMDTAKITIPAISRVQGDDTSLPASSVETARLFREGDKVVIELGYDGRLRKEFEGFVRRVNFSTPVELELEGYGWQLRRKNINKSWKEVKLLDVLKEVVKGTDIVLSKRIPDNMKLEKLYLTNVNGLEVLDYLKDKLYLTAYFNFNELYVGLQQADIKGTTKFRLGWNVIKDNNLKYKLAEDTRVLVRVQRKLPKNQTKVLYEVGDKGGAVQIINLPNISDADAKKFGDEALQKAKYTGYEGKLPAFLVPYCEPGYTAIIEDPKYNERGGTYFVTSIEVSFGMGGARRTTEVSTRLD